MSINEFLQKHKIKSKATSKVKIHSICTDVDMYSGDGPFISIIPIVKLHATKGTQWVAYNKQNYFDSYRICPPEKLCKFIIREMDPVFSECENQGLVFFSSVGFVYTLFDKSFRNTL